MLILCTITLRIAGIVSKDPKVSPLQHVEERGIGEDAREGSRSSTVNGSPSVGPKCFACGEDFGVRKRFAEESDAHNFAI